MCGIAGVIGRDKKAADEAVAKMIAAQRHRGPDDQGQELSPFGDQFLALGHRRLAIIDLTSAGHQPMIHPRTGDQIIFNGEIYNFAELKVELEAAGETFVGHSDTEVLLHGLSRYGAEYVKRLQGMFAFAFYNAREQALILARDSLGIKPLYIARCAQGLLFASEVRAILASGWVTRELDPQGVAGLLAYGSLQQPLTLWKGIECFPRACYQVFHASGNGAVKAPVRYWMFPALRSDVSEEEVIMELRETFDAAVGDHLVADVPVGVFLSSGLDSTIVAALAAQHSSHIRSFTVAFADQPDLSEGPLAAETAAEFGLDHTEIQITGADAEQAAVAWMNSLDQPSMDGLNVFVISQAVRQHGITVALSGQGGDELFGGYSSFRDVPRLRKVTRAVGWLPRGVRGALAKAAGIGRSEAVGDKLIDIFRGSGAAIDLCLQRRRAMSNAQLAALGVDARSLGLLDNFLTPRCLAGVRTDEPDLVALVSQVESWCYQGNTLLHVGDTNGMAHSLEIRVPILDQRILDLVSALPGSVRLPDQIANKHLLRKAFGPLLRDSITQQAKRGFSLPIRRWMAGPLREMCEEALSSLKSVGILVSQGVEQIWQSFLAQPETPIWSRAFTLVVLGAYIRRQAEDAPVSRA